MGKVAKLPSSGVQSQGSRRWNVEPLRSRWNIRKICPNLTSSVLDCGMWYACMTHCRFPSTDTYWKLKILLPSIAQHIVLFQNTHLHTCHVHNATMADIKPPFTEETAKKKVKAAQDIWNAH